MWPFNVDGINIFIFNTNKNYCNIILTNRTENAKFIKFLYKIPQIECENIVTATEIKTRKIQDLIA